MKYEPPDEKKRLVKRQFLLHLDESVIRRVKILAIELNSTASSLVERALLTFFQSVQAERATPEKPQDSAAPGTQIKEDRGNGGAS